MAGKIPGPKAYWKTIIGSLVIAFVVGLTLQWVAWKFGGPVGPYPAGTQVAPFSLAPLDGGQPRSFAELSSDKKVTVLNFWATWCAPCLAELPSLVRLREKYAAKGVEVLLVSVDEEAKTVVPPTLKKLGVSFPTYFDETQALSDQFAVSALPKSYVFGADGKVLDIVVGDLDWMGPAFLGKLDGWLASPTAHAADESGARASDQTLARAPLQANR